MASCGCSSAAGWPPSSSTKTPAGPARSPSCSIACAQPPNCPACWRKKPARRPMPSTPGAWPSGGWKSIANASLRNPKAVRSRSPSTVGWSTCWPPTRKPAPAGSGHTTAGANNPNRKSATGSPPSATSCRRSWPHADSRVFRAGRASTSACPTGSATWSWSCLCCAPCAPPGRTPPSPSSARRPCSPCCGASASAITCWLCPRAVRAIFIFSATCAGISPTITCSLPTLSAATSRPG